MASPGARVRLLPPAVYLVPLGAAVALDRVAHLPRFALPPVGLVIAALLSLAGAGLFLWAGQTLLSRGTTVIPWHAVDTLVTSGPFARSRNPIYVGDALIYLGLAGWAGSWTALVVFPVILWVMTRWVIQREEAYLTQRFGTAYQSYAVRVRRWV